MEVNRCKSEEYRAYMAQRTVAFMAVSLTLNWVVVVDFRPVAAALQPWVSVHANEGTPQPIWGQ